jgi:monoamine oxidase
MREKLCFIVSLWVIFQMTGEKCVANAAISSNKRVVVIGGGIAGLAACQKLVVVYGQQNVVCIEGDSRLGGRINSNLVGKNTKNFLL